MSRFLSLCADVSIFIEFFFFSSAFDSIVAVVTLCTYVSVYLYLSYLCFLFVSFFNSFALNLSVLYMYVVGVRVDS